MSYPVTPFGHRQRLTDNIGLLRHADGVMCLHKDGYSVNDVARGLVGVCREPSPPPAVSVRRVLEQYSLAPWQQHQAAEQTMNEQVDNRNGGRVPAAHLWPGRT